VYGIEVFDTEHARHTTQLPDIDQCNLAFEHGIGEVYPIEPQVMKLWKRLTDEGQQATVYPGLNFVAL
jgi:hypothetical protein